MGRYSSRRHLFDFRLTTLTEKFRYGHHNILIIVSFIFVHMSVSYFFQIYFFLLKQCIREYNIEL
nr:unnamed protein product [Callosobruchus chinensis]